MRFQVGRFTCELSIDDDGSVQTQWFLRNGRKTEPPLYLDAADRRQYRAGRDAFLRAAGKLPARLGPAASWCVLRLLAPALLVAATLTGCARGGGIGLEAMLADHNWRAGWLSDGHPRVRTMPDGAPSAIGDECCRDAGLLSTPAGLPHAAAQSRADVLLQRLDNRRHDQWHHDVPVRTA